MVAEASRKSFRTVSAETKRSPSCSNAFNRSLKVRVSHGRAFHVSEASRLVRFCQDGSGDGYRTGTETAGDHAENASSAKALLRRVCRGPLAVDAAPVTK